jgi:zinc transport system substrate-binding protein
MLRLLLLIPLLFYPGQATAGGVNVAVSIKPLHSLISSLMLGVGEPDLVITAAGSPHSYNLRPSEVRLLHRADLVVWIGPELESVLARPLANRKSPATIITLLEELPSGQLLPTREGGDWSKAEQANHHGEHDHDHGQIDPHIWLSVNNARTIATIVEARLAEIDPANRQRYESNLAALQKRLADLEQATEERLAPLRQQNYLVFHDAYQYFEKQFGLNPVGALAVDPDRLPGARRLTEIKRRIRDSAISCIFAEPQFEPRMVDILAEGTAIRIGVLDPIGAELTPGEDLYFNLLSAMASSLQTCLAGKGQ